MVEVWPQGRPQVEGVAGGTVLSIASTEATYGDNARQGRPRMAAAEAYRTLAGQGCGSAASREKAGAISANQFTVRRAGRKPFTATAPYQGPGTRHRAGPARAMPRAAPAFS